MSEAKPPKKMPAALQSTWRVRKAWDEDGWEIYPDYKTKLGDPCEVARTTDAHKAPRWVAELIADAGNTYNTTGLTPSQLVEQRDGLAGLLSEIYEMVRQGALPNDGDEWFELTIAAISKARPNTAEGEAAQQAPAAERENLELRRMLCIAHAGAAAYMDDGEAQDNRELPLIDFLHDTPAEIQDKLQRRALKKLAMTTEATTARWPSYEVAVSDPVFQVARSIMGTENMGQDRQLVAAINHVLAAAPTPAAAKEPSP